MSGLSRSGLGVGHLEVRAMVERAGTFFSGMVHDDRPFPRVASCAVPAVAPVSDSTARSVSGPRKFATDT
jgi:hypothetical protein